MYKKLNLLLLMIFIVGTLLCYHNLPQEISLFMQSPHRNVFVGISFVILLVLAIVALYPKKISGSDNAVRNEITGVVLNLFGIFLFLFYFTILAMYSGLQIDYLRVIGLIIGVMMIFVGNFLPQMPFRSRIGMKLPWILKDKRCWQKTHRFAGYTAIPFGILQCLLVLFMQDINMIFLWGIGLWLILVCGYSLIVFHADKENQ